MMPVSYYFILMGFMDMCSVSIFIPYMSQFGRRLGSTPKWTGLAGSFYGLFQVVSSPIVGRLSDKYGRKPIMIICYSVTSVGYAVLTVTASYTGFVLARIISGSFKQGILLSKAYLSDVTAANSFTEVMGSFASSVTAGAAIGVVIGGHLATFDPTFFTSGVAITATFSFLTIFMFFVPSQTQISVNTKSKNPSFTNIPSLLIRYWDVLLLRLAQQLAEILYYTSLMLFLEDNYLFSLKEGGYILAFNSVCAIIAARSTNIILNKIYNNNNIILILHFTFLCASGYLMLLSLDVSILFLALFLIESSSMIFRLAHLNLLMSRVACEDRGVAIGLITSVGSVAKIIAPGLSGYLYELDYKYPMVVSCCCCLSSLFVLFIVSKNTKYTTEESQVTN